MFRELILKLGYDVRKKGKAPTESFEIDCINLISTIDADQSNQVVFDVGANVGQTAAKISTKLPNALIYCYEPFPSSFAQLQENCGSNEHIKLKQIGLSSIAGYVSSAIEVECSQTNRFSKNDIQDSKPSDKSSLLVNTVDKEMESEGISHLWLLKTDTEGMELEVLQGASKALKRNAISWIYVEVGLTSIQEHHRPLQEINRFLKEYNYIFSGCFELCFNRHYSYCNALFRTSAKPGFFHEL